MVVNVIEGNQLIRFIRQMHDHPEGCQDQTEWEIKIKINKILDAYPGTILLPKFPG